MTADLKARYIELRGTLLAAGAHVGPWPTGPLTAARLRALCADARERARVLASPEAAAHVARAREGAA